MALAITKFELALRSINKNLKHFHNVFFVIIILNFIL